MRIFIVSRYCLQRWTGTVRIFSLISLAVEHLFKSILDTQFVMGLLHAGLIILIILEHNFA